MYGSLAIPYALSKRLLPFLSIQRLFSIHSSFLHTSRTLCITSYALYHPPMFLTSQLRPSPCNGFLIYHKVLAGRPPLGKIHCYVGNLRRPNVIVSLILTKILIETFTQSTSVFLVFLLRNLYNSWMRA